MKGSLVLTHNLTLPTRSCLEKNSRSVLRTLRYTIIFIFMIVFSSIVRQPAAKYVVHAMTITLTPNDNTDNTR